MKTIVNFHQGTRGSGVIVSVTYNKSRIIFDFGAPFNHETNVYDGVVVRRNKSALKDQIILGNAPSIDGIYPQNLVEGLSIVPYEATNMTTGIVISHLHLDHMSNIGYVHPDIPVYMSKEALALQEALNDVHENVGERSYTGVELYESISIGEITAIPYFSDHPCFGSVGYLIKTPDSTIYYSGDIRFHGLQRERAFEELNKLTKENIDLLIIDGTTYSPKEFIHDESTILKMNQPSQDYLEGQFSEQGIYDDVYQYLINSKGVGIFNIYHRDMQLIHALIDVAKRTNRTIVFEPETAYILYFLFGYKVYYYLPDAYEYTTNEKYLSIIKNNCILVDTKEIQKNQKEYLVECNYHNLLELFSLTDGQTPGEYFHLFGEPFTKKGKANHSLEMIIEKCHLHNHSYANLFSFNHAFPNHLCYMIEKIHAKSVVAVHSSTPEALNPMNSQPFFPKQNVDYILSKGILSEK